MTSKVNGKRSFSNGKPLPLVTELHAPANSAWKCILLFIAIAGSLRCTGRPANPSSIENHEPDGSSATTQPSRGLVLLLRANKTRVKAGDDLEVTEELENATNHEIWENFRTFSLGAEELAAYPPIHGLPAAEKTSTAYPFTKNSRPRPLLFDIREAPGLPQAVMTSKHFATRVLPGGTRPITHRFKILRPGVYSFSAIWTSSYSADHREVLWKGELRSNPVKLTVLPGRF